MFGRGILYGPSRVLRYNGEHHTTLLVASAVLSPPRNFQEQVSRLSGQYQQLQNFAVQFLSDGDVLLPADEYMPKQSSLQRAANFNFATDCPPDKREQWKEVWRSIGSRIGSASLAPKNKRVYVGQPPEKKLTPNDISQYPSEYNNEYDSQIRTNEEHQLLSAGQSEVEGRGLHNPHEHLEYGSRFEHGEASGRTSGGLGSDPFDIRYRSRGGKGLKAFNKSLYAVLGESDSNVWNLVRPRVSSLERAVPLLKPTPLNVIETPKLEAKSWNKISTMIDAWLENRSLRAASKCCTSIECQHGDFLLELKKGLMVGDEEVSSLQLMNSAWLYLCSNVYADLVSRELTTIEDLRIEMKSEELPKWVQDFTDKSMISNLRYFFKRTISPAWGIQSNTFSHTMLQQNFQRRSEAIKQLSEQILSFTCGHTQTIPLISNRIHVQDREKRFQLGRHLYLDLKHRTRKMFKQIFDSVLEGNPYFLQRTCVVLQDLQLARIEDFFLDITPQQQPGFNTREGHQTYPSAHTLESEDQEGHILESEVDFRQSEEHRGYGFRTEAHTPDSEDEDFNGATNDKPFVVTFSPQDESRDHERNHTRDNETSRRREFRETDF